MSNVDKIILIGGKNIVLYIILYFSLNVFTILFYMFINNMARKRKLKNNTKENDIDEKYELDNDIKIKLGKYLTKEKFKQKVMAHIFLLLFWGFIIFIIMDIYNFLNKNIVYNIFGIIILLSMYTSIHFYEYFIVSKINNKGNIQN